MTQHPTAAAMPPQEIVDAALKVERWFTQQGITRWQFGGICSCNFAFDLPALIVFVKTWRCFMEADLDTPLGKGNMLQFCHEADQLLKDVGE